MDEIIWMQAAPRPEFQAITPSFSDHWSTLWSKRNHSPSSIWKHGTHLWVSVRILRIYWQMFCRRNFPLTLKVRNNWNSLDMTNATLFRLFCRYHFTAVLKRLQPDHKSWLLSVLPRCHRDFGCHTLVLIPPRGQQTTRTTEALGELCQP